MKINYKISSKICSSLRNYLKEKNILTQIMHRQSNTSYVRYKSITIFRTTGGASFVFCALHWNVVMSSDRLRFLNRISFTTELDPFLKVLSHSLPSRHHVTFGKGKPERKKKSVEVHRIRNIHEIN